MTRSNLRLFTPLVLLLGLSSGCATTSPQDDDPVLVKLEAQLAESDDYDTRWRTAVACLDLVESHQVTTSSRKLDYAQRALKHAEAAIAFNPRKVEGHYYRAIALGRVLEHSTLPTRGKMLELEKSGQRAREIDPGFKEGGPLIFLALLYQKAPPWPFGPELAREEDVIEELYEEAVKVAPTCATNLLYYAEFLAQEEREEEAKKLAAKAREALKTQTDLPLDERVDLSRRIRAIEATGKGVQARD